MTSSERLNTMLARFEISPPRKAIPRRPASEPAAVNGVDVLRRLLQGNCHATAG